LGVLESTFAAGEKVSPETLLAKEVVRAIGGRVPRIKILGTGEISKALVIEHCALSASARAAIEKAGGTIHAQ
jgi:large subunit ribosomal protein L15